MHLTARTARRTCDPQGRSDSGLALSRGAAPTSAFLKYSPRGMTSQHQFSPTHRFFFHLAITIPIKPLAICTHPLLPVAIICFISWGNSWSRVHSCPWWRSHSWISSQMHPAIRWYSLRLLHPLWLSRMASWRPDSWNSHIPTDCISFCGIRRHRNRKSQSSSFCVL